MVPRGARGRTGLTGAGEVLVPPGPRRPRRRDADELDVQLLGSDLDADDRSRRQAGRVVPPPVHRRISPTSTGVIPTSVANTRTSCDSGSIAASPASGSTRRRSSSRTRRSRRSRPTRGRASTRPSTATSSTRSIGAGGRSPTRIPAARILVGEIWLPDMDRFARYLRPDELHTAFNFDFLGRPVGCRPPARLDRQHDRGPRARSARHRPGSSRTTM